MHPPLQPQYERLGLREPSLEASVRFPVIMSGMSSSYPFTPSQWQELEQQRLFYRYMVSGIPNPWDLSLRIRRSFLLEPTTMISPTVAYPPHLHCELLMLRFPFWFSGLYSCRKWKGSVCVCGSVLGQSSTGRWQGRRGYRTREVQKNRWEEVEVL